MGVGEHSANAEPHSRGDGLDGVPDEAQVVFVSYAREDEEWRRRFEVMLAPLGERGVAVWSDERIVAGAAWRPELARAIAALVLVSPELLASRFVMHEELPALQARGIPLAYVHVRASLAERVGAFADVQWAHDRGRPLTGAADADGEIVRICEKLADLLPVRATRTGGPDPVGVREGGARPSPRSAGPGDPGALHGVPAPARGEIERDELAQVREALLGESGRRSGSPAARVPSASTARAGSAKPSSPPPWRAISWRAATSPTASTG